MPDDAHGFLWARRVASTLVATASVHRRAEIVRRHLLLLDLGLGVSAGILQRDRSLALHILRDPEQGSLERGLRGLFLIAVALVAVEAMRGARIGEHADIGPEGAKLAHRFQRNQRVIL